VAPVPKINHLKKKREKQNQSNKNQILTSFALVKSG
jgi:hypothetical protein